MLGMSGTACAYEAEEADRTSDNEFAVQSAYGGPPIGFTDGTVSTAAGIPFPTTGGDVGVGGAPAGGTGGTNSGGAAGEANDTNRGGAAGEADDS
ncbi:MAG TPA: hypothetical protein VNN80_09040 [Polyangiaceae bacterium]|nr:hypothetical protein [Polyangiaceae bacterium]